jgi:hypothetical protein
MKTALRLENKERASTVEGEFIAKKNLYQVQVLNRGGSAFTFYLGGSATHWAGQPSTAASEPRLARANEPAQGGWPRPAVARSESPPVSAAAFGHWAWRLGYVTNESGTLLLFSKWEVPGRVLVTQLYDVHGTATRRFEINNKGELVQTSTFNNGTTETQRQHVSWLSNGEVEHRYLSGPSRGGRDVVKRLSNGNIRYQWFARGNNRTPTVAIIRPVDVPAARAYLAALPEAQAAQREYDRVEQARLAREQRAQQAQRRAERQRERDAYWAGVNAYVGGLRNQYGQTRADIDAQNAAAGAIQARGNGGSSGPTLIVTPYTPPPVSPAPPPRYTPPPPAPPAPPPIQRDSFGNPCPAKGCAARPM